MAERRPLARRRVRPPRNRRKLVNIFQDATTKMPKSDSQIKKIDFTQSQIGGRTDHIPTPNREGDMAIRHVPNAGSTR